MPETNSAKAIALYGYIAGFTTKKQYERLAAVLAATADTKAPMTISPVENRETGQRGVALCIVDPEVVASGEEAYATDMVPLALIMTSDGDDLWHTWQPMDFTQKQQDEAFNTISQELAEKLINFGAECEVPEQRSDA